MRLLAFMAIFIVIISANSFAQGDECDYSVDILIDDNEFESKDFTWRMKATKIEGGQTTITGTAKIEDNNGKTAKSYKPWLSEAISRQKTSSKYTPNLKPGNYEIIAEINVGCDDKDPSNNADKEGITIKGNGDEKDTKDENTDETETDNANDPKPPTNIKPQSNTLSAKPDLQPVADNTIQLNMNSKNKNSQMKLQSNAIKSEETVYKSSNEKAKGLIMISLLFLSILFNVILIWKR